MCYTSVQLSFSIEEYGLNLSASIKQSPPPPHWGTLNNRLKFLISAAALNAAAPILNPAKSPTGQNHTTAVPALAVSPLITAGLPPKTAGRPAANPHFSPITRTVRTCTSTAVAGGRRIAVPVRSAHSYYTTKQTIAAAASIRDGSLNNNTEYKNPASLGADKKSQKYARSVVYE